MNEQVREGLATILSGFIRLEGRRKGLAVLQKRMQEDIEECLKRVEEVKLTKKRVPLYLPRCDLPVELEEEPIKVRKRRGKRKEEYATSENNADSKVLAKSRQRKRASDDDLVEEQPVPKRRGITESKANLQDTPKKVLRAKSTFSEKRSILENVDNVLEEKDKNNSYTIDIVNGNGTVLNTETSYHQVMVGEKPLVDIDKNSKSKKCNKFVSSDEGNKKSEDIVQSKASNKLEKADKTIFDREKTVILSSSQHNANLEDERLTTKNTEITRIEMKSVTNVFKPGINSTVLSSSNQVNSTVKKNETLKLHQNSNSKLLKSINLTVKNTIILSSQDEVQDERKENLEPVDNNNKQENALRNETGTNDFVVPLVPPIHITNANSSQLSSDEGPPAQKRFTRSKSKAVGKEKICPPSSSESSSNEDSPVKKRSTRSKVVKGKELFVSSSVENIASSSDEAPVSLPRITRSKMAKPKDQPQSNLYDCNNTPPTQEEGSPVSNIRMTRSKMAKPKKGKMDAGERSGEESDARSEFNSCSDGEMGKKKVKDIVKMINEKHAMVLLSPIPITKEQEKENHIGILKILKKKDKITPIMNRKGVITKTTPLQVRNGYITPNKKPAPIISSATKNKSVMDDVEKRKKEEEARLKRLKEEEVLRKKQEMLKIKQEELKKRHEEKMLKAAAMREAAEKEKTECILKQERDREEREKMARAEIERKKIEEAQKKKMAYQTKAAEVENRRLREEAARAAKLKEMEEEQRQHEELRQKQLEENERIMKMRQEDQRAKEVSKQKLLYQKEIQKKIKANMLPLKDKDNYSITGDLMADEDSEDMDEENSKKEIPTWAKKEERLLPSKIQVYYPMNLVMDFFCCPSSSPDLTDIFGKMTMKRIRSSSAVWLDSPPLKVFQSVNN
ncbi:inner centromere protein isoform X2 [Halyomorpha halys]|uniref:inner centromere protein isoform X2 n=1 Tax=Halyomorpha halys TaxID=286706 RepID=UPI0034D1989E